MSQELTVTHPATGEMLDLSAQDTAALVDLIGGAQAFHRRLADFEREVGQELLDRMDRDACWTLRVDGYEVKAPSPTAGTEAYPPDALEAELKSLIAQGVVSTDAATKACRRCLYLELAVPWSADHRQIAAQVKDAVSIEVAGVQVKVLASDARTRSTAAGVTALRKVPGVGEALDRAKVNQPPPTRKPTVKRVDEPGQLRGVA